MNTYFHRPFSDAVSFAVYSQEPISPGIAGLLNSCGPSAIPRFIVPVDIWESIKAVILRAWPHVFEKICKALCPAITHRYAATTPIFVCNGFMIEASLFGHNPRRKCARFIPAALTVFCKMVIALVAAATFSLAQPQRFLLGDDFAATIAPTTPVGSNRSYHAIKNNQATKSLTSEINKMRHSPVFVSHRAANIKKILGANHG